VTKNTIQRLLVFFIGIPIFVYAALFLSFAHNLVFVFVILLVQIQIVAEFGTFFERKSIPIRTVLIDIASVTNTTLMYLTILFANRIGLPFGPLEILIFSSVIGGLVVLLPEIFGREGTFDAILARSSASTLVFFYSGVLGAFLVFITSGFNQATASFLSFLLMTFGNDSLAWLVGVTVGKKRGIVAVSPNKSLAGFVAGALGSIIAGLLAFFLFPTSFPSLLPVLVLGAFMGVTVIAGDLLESAFKRSCGLKDSSSIIPGRGGVLDSIDSLLYSAPFFVLLSMLFGMFSGASL
jgi:phosphatidate cytidylyltransferase